MDNGHKGKTMQLANKFRQFRLKKKLKQTDVAEKAGINANYYAKVERGEAKPSVETLEKILKALNVKSSDILPF